MDSVVRMSFALKIAQGMEFARMDIASVKRNGLAKTVHEEPAQTSAMTTGDAMRENVFVKTVGRERTALNKYFH